MSALQPAAHTQRHRRAIHVKAVGRDAGLWSGDESLSCRRALVGHSETIKPADRALIGLNFVSVVPVIPAFDCPDSLDHRFDHRQAAHRHARGNCTSLKKLRGQLPQSIRSTFPDDAALHGEAPCRAGHAGDLAAFIDSEAESMFQLNRCHTLRMMARSAMQFYSRGNDLAPRSKRVAQALCTGNEVQSNSQT